MKELLEVWTDFTGTLIIFRDSLARHFEWAFSKLRRQQPQEASLGLLLGVNILFPSPPSNSIIIPAPPTNLECA